MAEPLDLSALEAGERLLANTTPAGWEVYDQPHSDTGWLIFGPDGDGLVTCHGNTGYGFTGGPPGGDPETDARALVWLRNHAPALIALARAGLTAEAIVTPVGYRTMTPEERTAWVEWLEARGVIPTAGRPESGKGGAE